MFSASVRSLVALGGLVLASGCGERYVSRGTALYAEGRYVDAAEVFERTEQRLASSDTTEQARFGLYRGATFLKLGDLEHASRWLGYTRGVLKRDPGALDDRELALLEASFKALAAGKTAPPAPGEAAVARSSAGMPGDSELATPTQ